MDRSPGALINLSGWYGMDTACGTLITPPFAGFNFETPLAAWRQAASAIRSKAVIFVTLLSASTPIGRALFSPLVSQANIITDPQTNQPCII